MTAIIEQRDDDKHDLQAGQSPDSPRLTLDDMPPWWWDLVGFGTHDHQGVRGKRGSQMSFSGSVPSRGNTAVAMHILTSVKILLCAMSYGYTVSDGTSQCEAFLAYTGSR